ncbi:MAG: hypothetical protein R3F02_05470 [Thiolinea sp.]
MNLANAIRSSVLLFSSVILLSACGGGSDSSNDPVTETLTGVFIDAPVEGLGYQTPNHQGKTNDKGEFTYDTGETVTFFFNGIDLGSAPAQAKFPVTLLPNSPKLAQIFQTLDHNADPAKIDVSGITLDAGLKTQLTDLLANKAGTPDLEAILTNAKLAELQTSNNVTLVNQSVVTEAEAAGHLSDNIDPIAMSASDFANKLFLDSDGGGIGSDIAVAAFYQNGTATFQGQGDYGDYYNDSVTWSVSNDGTTNITFPDSSTYVATKLSESDNRHIFHVTGGGDEEFIREFYEALPLSLADLNGKHFAIDTSDDEYCSATTLSFNGTNVTVNEQCTGGFDTFTVQAAEHDQLDNVIVFQAAEDNGDSSELHIALIGGSLENGQYAEVEYDNSAIDHIGILRMAETDAPLTAQ